MTSPSIYPLLLAFSSCMFHQWPYRWCPFRWIISIDQSGDEGEGWHGAGRGGGASSPSNRVSVGWYRNVACYKIAPLTKESRLITRLSIALLAFFAAPLLSILLAAAAWQSYLPRSLQSRWLWNERKGAIDPISTQPLIPIAEHLETDGALLSCG